jgi:glycerol uptake facilitator-like aquaporin
MYKVVCAHAQVPHYLAAQYLMYNVVCARAQVPHYLAAQYLGAFTASCVVFLVYWDALVW